MLLVEHVFQLVWDSFPWKAVADEHTHALGPAMNGAQSKAYCKLSDF